MSILTANLIDEEQVHTLVILIGGVLLYIICIITKRLWILNNLMIKGAILGILINFLISQIIHIYNHKGDGVVNYGGGERDDRYEMVDETEYKKQSYMEDGVALFIVLIFWFVIADIENKKLKDNI